MMLAPWKKSYDQPRQHIKTHYFSTKVHLVKAMVFPVVVYGCDSWTVKKAERQRIDAFELWCWRSLLRVLWTARRSNQSIIKAICDAQGSLAAAVYEVTKSQTQLSDCTELNLLS